MSLYQSSINLLPKRLGKSTQCRFYNCDNAGLIGETDYFLKEIILNFIYSFFCKFDITFF